MPAPLVQVEGVTKVLGRKRVLGPVDLELTRGGRYALLGPNGAGKSTLIRLLAGVLYPDSGRVMVAGLEPRLKPVQLRRLLGWLPEEAPLNGDLSVKEHLQLAAALRRLSAAAFKNESDRLSAALNLGSLWDLPARSLSRGGRRRAALATALLGDPEFIILDEPTSGLDPEESSRLRDLLLALPPNRTLLISSHNLSQAAAMTRQGLVLKSGEIKNIWQFPEFELSEQSLEKIYSILLTEPIEASDGQK